jgi:hypothetical protein
VMMERVEMHPGMAPTDFPLQSSQIQPPFHGFRVPPLPPLENASGLYIVVFRSSPSI